MDTIMLLLLKFELYHNIIQSFKTYGTRNITHVFYNKWKLIFACFSFFTPDVNIKLTLEPISHSVSECPSTVFLSLLRVSFFFFHFFSIILNQFFFLETYFSSLYPQNFFQVEKKRKVMEQLSWINLGKSFIVTSSFVYLCK